MAQYRSGTVSVTNGSATVTGAGTAWSGKINVDDLFAISGSLPVYQVLRVDSDTQLTLRTNYAGLSASGQRYAITRDFTPNHDLPYLTPGDDVAPIFAHLIRRLDSTIPASGNPPAQTQGMIGTSAYSFIAYADDALGTGFSLTPTDSARYVGFATSSSANQPTTADGYAWFKLNFTIFQGNWSANRTYSRGDITRSNGNVWILDGAATDTSTTPPHSRLGNIWLNITGGSGSSSGGAAIVYATSAEARAGTVTNKVMSPATTKAAIEAEAPPTPRDFIPLFHSTDAATQFDSTDIRQGETAQLFAIFSDTPLHESLTGADYSSGRIQFADLSTTAAQDATVVVKLPLRMSYIRAEVSVYLNAYDTTKPNVVLPDESYLLREVTLGDNSLNDQDIVLPTNEVPVKLRGTNRTYRVVVRAVITSSTSTQPNFEFAINHGNDSERFGIWITPTNAVVDPHEVYDATDAPNYKAGRQVWYDGNIYKALVDAPTVVPSALTRTIPAQQKTKTIEMYPEFNLSRTKIGLSIIGNAADHFGETPDSLVVPVGGGNEILQISTVSPPPGAYTIEFRGTVVVGSSPSTVGPISIEDLGNPSSQIQLSGVTRQVGGGQTVFSFGSTVAFVEGRHYSLDLIYWAAAETTTEWERIQDAGYGEWVTLYQATSESRVTPVTLSRSVHDAKEVLISMQDTGVHSSQHNQVSIVLREPYITPNYASANANNPQWYYHRHAYGGGSTFRFDNPDVNGNINQIVLGAIQGTAFSIWRVQALY